jgi:hypothetical protein
VTEMVAGFFCLELSQAIASFGENGFNTFELASMLLSVSSSSPTLPGLTIRANTIHTWNEMCDLRGYVRYCREQTRFRSRVAVREAEFIQVRVPRHNDLRIITAKLR